LGALDLKGLAAGAAAAWVKEVIPNVAPVPETMARARNSRRLQASDIMAFSSKTWLTQRDSVIGATYYQPSGVLSTTRDGMTGLRRVMPALYFLRMSAWTYR
jgi:hypothetical protein